MEENTQHVQHIMLYYFKKGKNATETQKKKSAMYGERAGTEQTCQKWVVKFHAGEFSLDDDAPQSGRQLKTVNVIPHGIASILRMSKSIKVLVKMKYVSFISQKKLSGVFGQPNI